MTENYLPGSAEPPHGEALAPEQGTAHVKDHASDLGHSSVQTGKHVADVAREQASGVAAEAGRQGRDLLQQAQGQMEEQAARGQRRVAERLLSLSAELRSMAGNPSQGGVAADLVQQAAARVGDAGQWLDAREPGQVVHEVQSFARRRPTAFLLLAAGAGLVAGQAHPRADRRNCRQFHGEGRVCTRPGAWRTVGPAPERDRLPAGNGGPR